MIYKKISLVSFIVLFVLGISGPTTVLGGNEREKVKQKSKQKEVKKKSSVLTRMPVYKPPRRGAPGRRIGGGTRGVMDAEPILYALAPNHPGLTVNENPSLYWFIARSTETRKDFTLIHENAIKPVIEIKLGGSDSAGLHKMRLSEHGISLKQGIQYEWYISLVPDPGHRSNDIIATGIIERIDPSKMLRERLNKASREEIPHIYAQEGLWYDAFSAISDLIDANPGNETFVKQRNYLLKQVGLGEVADQAKQ